MLFCLYHLYLKHERCQHVGVFIQITNTKTRTNASRQFNLSHSAEKFDPKADDQIN